MTHSPTPPPKTLPCQHDPERWFNRRHRRDTLAQCLDCPARPGCAQQALTWHACWGMWAGVWIDGQHADAAPYLRAIAADHPGPHHQRPTPPTADPPPDPTPPTPLPRPPAAGAPRSTTATVLARSCGHCEVFTEHCRYTFNRLVSRRRGHGSTENASPAELFAACTACADLVANLQPQLATRAGYVLDTGRDPAATPFHWRGARWVLLGHDGWLTELTPGAQSA